MMFGSAAGVQPDSDTEGGPWQVCMKCAHLTQIVTSWSFNNSLSRHFVVILSLHFL